MKILQVTNIVSHHQLPLARALVDIVGEKNFRFCAMKLPDVERERLGWNNQINESWILRAGEREKDRLEFEEWWNTADVVLCGERLFQLMHHRLKDGKLCFYMSERWWKPPIGLGRLFHPHFFKMVILFLKITKNPNFHYLYVGPFAKKDISLISNFQSRMWLWGYFMEPSQFTKINCLPLNNSINILWVGRMLDWKKVDTIIKALKELEIKKIPFKITLIGDGPERSRLEKMAFKLLSSDNFVFLDPVPAFDIPRIMTQHDVYILSSTAYEGWGAVINEAMDCGCVVVASKYAGAAASIIDDGVNGILFKPGDWRDLAIILIRISNDYDFRQLLSTNAKRTIRESWSPNVVAERFCKVSESLLYKKEIPLYLTGPMSKQEFEI